ncbi:MAG: Nif3-like dinuclear metal center hexameric protein [Synergistales bacterium]|nr:Nif3-like dinuclear metal center hexameric protein [Synergistales bacterium]
MDVKTLLERLDDIAPLRGAEDWDNCGLLLGSPATEVEGIAVALDVTEEVLSEAGRRGCNVVVSHHPPIFAPRKRITPEDPTGRVVIRAVQWDMTLIALHTNWDRAFDGTNVVLARRLGLERTAPLLPSDDGGLFGDGIVGTLPRPVSFDQLCSRVRRSWELPWLLGFPAAGAPGEVTKVALVGGSGADFWPAAAEQGASVFISADIAYHKRQDMLFSGICVCQVDHGDMEALSLDALCATIRDRTGAKAAVVHASRPVSLYGDVVEGSTE